MSRAPFNTTCDVFAGPGAPSPGEHKGTVDCRLVMQDGITLVDTFAPTRVAWITMRDLKPVGSFADPMGSMRPSLGDVFAVPSDTEPQFWNIYTEEILWRDQPLYYRANVGYLPQPEDCHCGGMLNNIKELVFGSKGGRGPFAKSGKILFGDIVNPSTGPGRGKILWGGRGGYPGGSCTTAAEVPWDYTSGPSAVFHGTHNGRTDGGQWWKWRPHDGSVMSIEVDTTHDASPADVMLTLYTQNWYTVGELTSGPPCYLMEPAESSNPTNTFASWTIQPMQFVFLEIEAVNNISPFHYTFQFHL